MVADADGNSKMSSTYATGGCFIVARKSYPAYQLILMGDRDVKIGVQPSWTFEQVPTATHSHLFLKVPAPLADLAVKNYSSDTFLAPNTHIALTFPSAADSSAFAACIVAIQDELQRTIKNAANTTATAVVGADGSGAGAGTAAMPAKKDKGAAAGRKGAAANTAAAANVSASSSGSAGGGALSATVLSPAPSSDAKPTILPKPSSSSAVSAAAQSLHDSLLRLSAEVARAADAPQGLRLGVQALGPQVERLLLDAQAWHASQPDVGAGAGVSAARSGASTGAAAAAAAAVAAAATAAHEPNPLLEAAALALARAPSGAKSGKQQQGQGQQQKQAQGKQQQAQGQEKKQGQQQKKQQQKQQQPKQAAAAPAAAAAAAKTDYELFPSASATAAPPAAAPVAAAVVDAQLAPLDPAVQALLASLQLDLEFS
jgi:hypothetical protein